jgi:antitoxin (DNA-binding transcriptional repressor) of toxin-antitoxin stability system
MERYSWREAGKQLHELLEDAQRGEIVLILDENNRAVQLVPVSVAEQPRKAGSARGQIVIADDFDTPLAGFARS